MTRLSPNAISLIQEALLASFWFKRSLKAFLRRMHIRESVLGRLDAETTKREFIDWLFSKLENRGKSERLLELMANELAKQEAFPDLLNLEDSKVKQKQAVTAVANLRQYLERERRGRDDKRESRRRREEADKRRLATISYTATLTKLRSSLDALATELGQAKAGYRFQDWFGHLAELFEVPYKKPYRTKHREVDGSVTIDGMTYLLSLKFTNSQSAPTDVSDLRDRVNRVADFTMGIMVSMSGFTKNAVQTASGPGTNLLLFDATHLYLVLSGAITLEDLVVRARRHASRTGEAYLAVDRFGR